MTTTKQEQAQRFIAGRRRPTTTRFESQQYGDGFDRWCYDLGRAFNTELFKRDVTILGGLFLGMCWISYSEPAIMLSFLFLSTIALAGKVLMEYTPRVGKIMGRRLRFSHVAVIITTLTFLTTVLPEPAHAALFDAIEEEVNTILNGAVDAATVGLIFGALRIIVIFGFIVGGIFLVNQAMQGGDWKPMANIMGIGLAFIIAIEVLTQLILGAA